MKEEEFLKGLNKIIGKVDEDSDEMDFSPELKEKIIELSQMMIKEDVLVILLAKKGGNFGEVIKGDTVSLAALNMLFLQQQQPEIGKIVKEMLNK